MPRPPLRSSDIRGEYNFTIAQPTEEIPAHWAEIIFLDRSAATPALLEDCLDDWDSNAILSGVITCHRAAATIRLFFGQTFWRSSCSPRFVDHVVPSDNLPDSTGIAERSIAGDQLK